MQRIYLKNNFKHEESWEAEWERTNKLYNKLKMYTVGGIIAGMVLLTGYLTLDYKLDSMNQKNSDLEMKINTQTDSLKKELPL